MSSHHDIVQDPLTDANVIFMLGSGNVLESGNHPFGEALGVVRGAPGGGSHLSQPVSCLVQPLLEAPELQSAFRMASLAPPGSFHDLFVGSLPRKGEGSISCGPGRNQGPQELAGATALSVTA